MEIIGSLLFMTILGVFACIILSLVTSSIKGTEGQHLNDTGTNAYKQRNTFANLVLYSGYNTTFTEIDSVIVSPYGIFCIEYKAHQGYIFGSKDQKYWTQCKYKGVRKQIYNPLLQNYKHIKALKLLLGNNLKAPIHSVVVFTNAQKVKVDSNDVLIGADSLRRFLRNHHHPVYSIQEWHKISRILAIASSHSESRMSHHVAELQSHLQASGAKSY